MRAIVAVMRLAIREALAARGAFWASVAVMFLNNIAWIIFWVLFFGEVGSIRGWQVDDVLTLFAVAATVFGLALTFMDNCRHIGELISNGDLDEVLVLPVNPMIYLLFRRINPVSVGDLFFGIALFAFVGDLSFTGVLLFVFASVTGTVVAVSFLTILGSLTFFTGGKGAHSELGFYALVTLSTYPMNLFGGATRLLMYSLVPTAFVTGLPNALMRDFSFSMALWLTLVAAAFPGAAIAVFHLGLRRYRSGALWKGVS